MTNNVSIIIPAKNEEKCLADLLPTLTSKFPTFEIIVVNDGSTDNTVSVCKNNNVKVHSHPYCMGNGAAVKSGARIATRDILVFMDADLQHNPDDIPGLISKLNEGYDMVVGARKSTSHASIPRRIANKFYNILASQMAGQNIKDLTSGFRAVRSSKFREFLYILPNGFSYPSTITMAFFRAGYPVAYKSIIADLPGRKSHINPIKDGIRFLLIIFRIGTLYSPLKLFIPISLIFFLTGLAYYIYTFALTRSFTNMSALLFTTSVIIFLIGLISEQITNLFYSMRKEKNN